ncbi:cyclophilin-like domain-containing protein, partial [Paraphysoderma sedebokerense]
FHDPPSLIAGKIVIELDEQQCPKTCENFYALCTGSKGFSKSVRTAKLHYKGAPIHRIVKDFIAQGGDFTRKDGSGGDSIYNGTFADEKNGLKKGLFNQGKGVVAMANSGRNSNTSQFFITLSPDAKKYSKLEGKHVVFGKVIEGLEVLEKLNAVAGEGEVPTQLVWISDCGSVS